MSDRYRLPRNINPVVLAKYYEGEAIRQAGNQEVRDRLAPDIYPRTLSTWNRAVAALDAHGGNILTETRYGGDSEYGITERKVHRHSTGLIALTGMTDIHVEHEVPAVRLRRMGARPQAIGDISDYDFTKKSQAIGAEFFMVRPTRSEDDSNPRAIRISESRLPAALGVLPDVVLQGRSMDMQVTVEPLDFEDEKGERLVPLIVPPHHPIKTFGITNNEQAAALVDSEAARYEANMALYGLIGAMREPVRNYPEYQIQ